MSPCFDMDSVVIANNTLGQLTAYYVATNKSLVAYDLKTNTSTVLVPLWLTNLTAADGPAMLSGFQEPDGNVTVLYHMGATSTNRLTIEWYGVVNGSFDLVYTQIYNQYGYDVTDLGQGYGVLSDTGWTYFMPNQTRIIAYNIYSNQTVNQTTSALPGWNSPAYVPTANQVMADVNDYDNHTIQVEVWNLTQLGGSWTIDDRMLWSAANSAITGVDANNMPYYFTPNGTQTLVWGLGVSEGFACHNLVVDLYQNISEDNVSAVENTGAVCTTDMSVGAFWDTSGYAFNGYTGPTEDAEYQSPFLDPLNKSTVYANNSVWFNSYITSRDFTRGAGPRVNTWSFFTISGFVNGFLNGNVPTNFTGGILTVYWLPEYTGEFGPIPPPPLVISVNPDEGPVGSPVIVSGGGFVGSTPLESLLFDGVEISTCANGSLTTDAAGNFSCTFSVPSGTFGATVTAREVGGRTASGTFSVTTTTILVITVAFEETGLRPDTDWSVTLNGTTNVSITGKITFAERNGTYPFDVGSIVGYTVATPTGFITVNGTNVTEVVQFTPIPPETYSVKFAESGLPSGTNWSVTIAGQELYSTAPAVLFAELNGTHNYSVGPMTGYAATPNSGFVTVNGAPVNVPITFAPTPPPVAASVNWTQVSATCSPSEYSITIQLVGNATGGSQPYTYLWNFGDGSATSTLQDPEHSYSNLPDSTTLTVTDDHGVQAIKSVTIPLIRVLCPSEIGNVLPLWSILVITISAGIGFAAGVAAYRRRE
jgi:hypothetical protein